MTVDKALKIFMLCGTSKAECKQCDFFLQNDCSIKFKQFMIDSIEQQQTDIEQLKANQPARCSECEYFTGELPHSCGENNGYCEHPVFGNSCCGSITCIDRYCNYGKTESEVTNNE